MMMAAGAQEDGGVVKTSHEPAQPSKDRENRDDRGKHFLEAGQRKRLTNLDSLAVPEQLIAFVEAQPLKILDAQRRDVGRPIGLCTLSHGRVPVGLVFPVKPLLKLQNPPTEVLDDLGQLSQRLLHRLDHLDRRDDFAYRRTRHVRRSVEADAQPERRAPRLLFGVQLASRLPYGRPWWPTSAAVWRQSVSDRPLQPPFSARRPS
ncbi:MAG TPA: hypothetical protein VGC82_12215 [Rhodopila sp.]